MTENTAASVVAAIEAAQAGYMSELKQAGSVWETKPAAGDGEEAWCARQVAEHIGGASLFFGARIAEAIGAPGPVPRRLEFASAAEAATGTAEVHAEFATVLARVTDDQLAMDVDLPRIGKQTVGGILTIIAHHYKDHANQIKTLRG